VSIITILLLGNAMAGVVFMTISLLDGSLRQDHERITKKMGSTQGFAPMVIFVGISSTIGGSWLLFFLLLKRLTNYDHTKGAKKQ